MAHICDDSVLATTLVYFEDFIESPDFETFRDQWIYLHSDHTPSLMDIISGWVTHGQATRQCGSYEVYLLSVIVITQEWARGEPGYGVPWVDDSILRIDVFGTPDSSDDILRHDALNRTVWAIAESHHRMTAAWAADSDRHHQGRMLDQIAAHLSK